MENLVWIFWDFLNSVVPVYERIAWNFVKFLFSKENNELELVSAEGQQSFGVLEKESTPYTRLTRVDFYLIARKKFVCVDNWILKISKNSVVHATLLSKEQQNNIYLHFDPLCMRVWGGGQK